MNRQNFLDCMYFIYFIRQKPAIKDFVIKVGVSTSKSIYIPYSEDFKSQFSMEILRKIQVQKVLVKRLDHVIGHALSTHRMLLTISLLFYNFSIFSERTVYFERLPLPI